MERINILLVQIWEQEGYLMSGSVHSYASIHKKGSKLDCANDYFRVCYFNSLLSVYYKVHAKIVAKKLEPFAKWKLGDYQCSFWQNRFTTDQIFAIQCILKKYNKFNVDVHQWFIDYKQEYDSIDCEYLYETLDSLGMLWNVMRFMLMTQMDSSCKVKMQNDVSWAFRIHHFGRHTHASCSISLLKVTRSININHKEILFTSNTNYLAYAGDIFSTGTQKYYKGAFVKLEEAAGWAGLKFNEDKRHGDAVPR